MLGRRGEHARVVGIDLVECGRVERLADGGFSSCLKVEVDHVVEAGVVDGVALDALAPVFARHPERRVVDLLTRVRCFPGGQRFAARLLQRGP